LCGEIGSGGIHVTASTFDATEQWHEHVQRPEHDGSVDIGPLGVPLSFGPAHFDVEAPLCIMALSLVIPAFDVVEQCTAESSFTPLDLLKEGQNRKLLSLTHVSLTDGLQAEPDSLPIRPRSPHSSELHGPGRISCSPCDGVEPPPFNVSRFDFFIACSFGGTVPINVGRP
jgi:hypothetical protein